jgi:membrane associated rhomboid family serine protease
VTPWVLRLIVANVLVYFLENTVPGLVNAFALVPAAVLGRPWTVVTYMFLHGGFTHILFNMIGLYFFGPRVEERLGSQRFLVLYFLSGLTGALFSMFFAFHAAVIGASAAVFGIMLAFARYWPDVQFLVFLIIPMRARTAVILMALFTLWSGLGGSRSGVADFAHLGGFVGAYVYLVWLERRAGIKKFRRATVAPVAKEALLNWKRVDPRSVHEVNRDEVNRILDKISAQGVSSLTAQEKLFLSNFVPPDDRVVPPT